MVAFIKKVINLGQSTDLTKSANSKISVQNIFSLSSIILAIPFLISCYLTNEWLIGNVFFTTQLILTYTLFLNGKKYYTLSKFILIALVLSVLPIFSYLFGFNSGFYLYYFLTPLLILSIFKFSEKKELIISFLLVLISCGVCFLNKSEYVLNTSVSIDFIQHQLYIVNFAIGLFLVTLMSFEIIKYHFHLIHELKASNKALDLNKKEIEKSIKEKDILLAEVHHRVKNNLAIMYSLLNLQIGHSDNELINELLRKNALRIRSMSLIHNSLYSEKEVSSIDFKQFIESLSSEIETSYSHPNKSISIICDVPNIHLALDLAIPCGLIINEIIVNSFKHAFNGKNSGTINVSFNLVSSSYVLTVSDDGIGFPNTENLELDSFGLSLIDTLTEQLDGELRISSQKGSSFTVKFPSTEKL